MRFGVPLITIGITSFNAADCILHAVRSALEQKWSLIEIVIVDDCSGDSSWALIDDVVRQNPDVVRALKMEHNSGVAACRNRIIAAARGEFICFFDDDDISVPHRLETQYRRIVGYEQAYCVSRSKILCHSARGHVFPDGRSRYLGTAGMNERRHAPDGIGLARRILTGKPIRDGFGSCPTCSQMASREFYRSLGGFDERLRRGEDTDLCVRAALAGCHVIGVSEQLVQQYMTLTSDKPLSLERQAWSVIFDKHRSLLERWGWYSYCHKWMDAKFHYLSGRYLRFVSGIVRLALRHPVRTIQRLCWSAPGWLYHLRFSSWRRVFS